MDNRPPPVSPTVVCTAYGPTRRKDESAGTSSAADGFGAADAIGLSTFRCTTHVRLNNSWTPVHPLPRRAVENSRMVNSSDSRASGGAFQVHPLGAGFARYTTPGTVDPLATTTKKRVEMAMGAWNRAVRRPTRIHHHR